MRQYALSFEGYLSKFPKITRNPTKNGKTLDQIGIRSLLIQTKNPQKIFGVPIPRHLALKHLHFLPALKTIKTLDFHS